MTEVIVPLAQVFVSPEGTAELAWQDQALCVQTDPEVFFPEVGGSPREAKKVCRSCPSRLECLRYALTRGELWGIWGGFSEHERCGVRRQLAAGRSLRDIIADDDAAFYARHEADAEQAATIARFRAQEREKAAADRAAIDAAQPAGEAA